MRASVVTLLALLAAPALADRQVFAGWKALHNKVYTSADEEALRYAIFAANLERVNTHNAKNLSWTMAMNEFGDLTPQEFGMARIGGYKPRGLRREKNIVALPTQGVPQSVDWTTKGAVTPVKNQQQCGSCWAFSTTGSTEGANFIANGKLISLSEQQLVDCSGSYGNQGCNGGLMDNAFKYIIAEGGLCTEASYPYTAQDGTCDKSCTKVVTLKSYSDVTPNSDTALTAAVAQQPVSIAVEADQSAWQLYSGGIVKGNCGTNLDHGVLAVGYDNSATGAYWKVKNSWGASWGEAGYIRLEKKSGQSAPGMCGLLMEPSWPSA